MGNPKWAAVEQTLRALKKGQTIRIKGTDYTVHAPADRQGVVLLRDRKQAVFTLMPPVHKSGAQLHNFATAKTVRLKPGDIEEGARMAIFTDDERAALHEAGGDKGVEDFIASFHSAMSTAFRKAVNDTRAHLTKTTKDTLTINALTRHLNAEVAKLVDEAGTIVARRARL
jgi:hypothetical protein